MSFTVQLRHGVQRDTTLATVRGIVLPFGEIAERGWEFPLLRGIDEYSVTYFSRLQMKDLFDELARLRRR